MGLTEKLTALLLGLLLVVGAFAVAGCNENGKPDQQATATTTTKATPTTEASKEVNANWTIEVNDKQTIESKGLPIDYTLEFTATKAGGTDPMGTYKGTAHLIIKSDFSKLKGIPQSVIKVMGGVNGQGDAADFTFKVVNMEEARKSNSNSGSDDAPLATLVPPKKDESDSDLPLATLVPPKKGDELAPSDEDKNVANPDFYSYGYMPMKGMGKLNIEARGIGGEHGLYTDQKSGNDKLAFSMNIVGATVYIDIPTAGRFKGTVTGDPIK